MDDLLLKSPPGTTPAPGAAPEFWAERWDSGRTGWDQQGPHPGLIDLVREAQSFNLLPPGCAILEPGCGRAHGGAALARLGYRVTAFDVIPTAVAEARRSYGNQPGLETLEILAGDALVVRDDWRGRFQAIYDRAVLCALPAPLRRSYVEACFFHLAPGGVLLTIPFTEVRGTEAEGPPYQVSMHALSDLLAAGFSLVSAEVRPAAPAAISPNTPAAQPPRVVKETLCIWRRRPKLLVESHCR